MKISILGAAGRMGQMIARELFSGAHGSASLVHAVEHDKSSALGKDLGELLGLGTKGIVVTADKDAAFKAADVIIDFTAPALVTDHMGLAAQYKKAIVVGTTGLDLEALAALEAASRQTAVFYSANMSLGVNILMSLVEQTAQRLGNEFDIEIFEAHHRHKVDAPSGTALMLGHAAAKGRDVSLEEAMVPARYGQIGARVPGSIGFSVFRGGDVVGDHTVTFAGMGERLELTHKASDRAIFAKGAVTAAVWLHGKAAGLYSMKDVLGL